MGILSRDYMKRPSGDDAQRSSTPANKLEAFLSGFVQKHPRFLIYVGVALVVLILLAIVAAKFADRSP